MTTTLSASRRTTDLSASRRAADLDRLTDGEVVDVCVIGGGITGAGVALDAASRGLSVALVEATDLAAGTSRFSSKLVHGGLRYLATGDVGLALQSARERDALLRRTAPHLTRALPFVLPLPGWLPVKERLQARAGLRVGDGLRLAAGTPASVLPRPRRLSTAEVAGLAPALDPAGLRGGMLSWDGQLVDDARLVVALARTAAGYGARVLTHLRADSVDAGLVGITDTLTGSTGTLHARHVVNATGVWADGLEPSVGLQPSRGSHLVLAASSVPGLTTGLMLPVPDEPNRFLLVLPTADGLVHLGLTDEPVDTIDDVPVVPESDERFLLTTASRLLARPLSSSDVIGRYAGLRPLLTGSADRSADLSRAHAVVERSDGMLTITGGKLTTYRAMAADVVDRIAARPGAATGPCVTDRLPLVGAATRRELAAVDAPARLVRRYGTQARRVWALTVAEPGLTEPVAPGCPVIGAELAFGAACEGALTVDDLLARRTRVTFVDAWISPARIVAERVLDDV